MTRREFDRMRLVAVAGCLLALMGPEFGGEDAAERPVGGRRGRMSSFLFLLAPIYPCSRPNTTLARGERELGRGHLR